MARPAPVRWLREHPLAADVALATLFATVSVLFHLFGDTESLPGESADPSWWGVALTVLATAPVAVRRLAPIPVLFVVVLAQVTCELLDVVGPGFTGVLIAVYTLGAHTSGPPRIRSAVLAAIVVGGLLVVGAAQDEVDVASVASSLIVLVGAYLIGDNVQRRRDAATALAERAERAERERDLLAHQRVTEERARIARDLHDVVAHSVSVMVIQAAAARRTLGNDPETATATLVDLEQTGRQAMTELRRVLGVLRDDAGDGFTSPREPQPALADLDQLLASNADLPITASLDPDALRDVPAGVAVAVYRVVQEALTNVRRHAGPVGHVDVALRRHDHELIVEVIDDGRGAAADRDEHVGYGVVGMRERTAASGGRLQVGPHRGGGWQVRAWFPMEHP